MLKLDIPPVERSQRSGFLDEKVLEISKELFEIPIFGYAAGALFNIFYLYHWYKRTTLFSLFYFIFLYYIILRTIQTKFFVK